MPALHEPTPELRKHVKAMSAYGTPQEDIAKCIGIDSKTLRKHYREELDVATTEANAKVAESLFRKATGDGPQSVTAAIFWMKTRAGWKDTSVHELTGLNGEPLPTPQSSVTVINDESAAAAYSEMIKGE